MRIVDWLTNKFIDVYERVGAKWDEMMDVWCDDKPK